MNILTLLKNGNYLGIKPGATVSAIIDSLNCSEERHILNEEAGTFLLLNSPIEAHFFNQALLGLVIKTRDLRKEEKIYIGDKKNFITNRTSLDEMIKVLNNLGIQWNFDTKNYVDKTVLIVTDQGATVEFNADEGKTCINRIRLWSWE